MSNEERGNELNDSNGSVLDAENFQKWIDAKEEWEKSHKKAKELESKMMQCYKDYLSQNKHITKTAHD